MSANLLQECTIWVYADRGGTSRCSRCPRLAKADELCGPHLAGRARRLANAVARQAAYDATLKDLRHEIEVEKDIKCLLATTTLPGVVNYRLRPGSTPRVLLTMTVDEFSDLAHANPKS